MKSEQKWLVIYIDGKLAAVSSDYRMLARISGQLVAETITYSESRVGETVKKKVIKLTDAEQLPYKEIKASVVGMEEVWKLRKEAKWEDLHLFGTAFQKKVWRKLWELTHPGESSPASETSSTDYGHNLELNKAQNPRLISYSDFAELCQNRAGVRAVAHAIGKNPISVIIPCHLVIPKESIDKIQQIQKKAESTIFKGEDLCLNSILRDKTIDFGEYSLGRQLKRELIVKELQ